MIKANKKTSIIKLIITVLLAIAILFIAYESAYDRSSVMIPELSRFEIDVFIERIFVLSISMFSLFYIIDNGIRKTLFKKERRIKDIIVLILFLCSTVYLINTIIG